MKRAPWEDRIILVAGIWLFVSPFAVGTPWLSHPATVTAMVCAAMLVSCTAESPAIPDAVQEWVVIAVSLGLAASPWLLDYSQLRTATVNAVAVAAVAALCALSALVRRRRVRPPLVL